MVLEDDLVDACKPGDRILISGVYKALPPRAVGTVSGVFKAVIVANHVGKLAHDSGGFTVRAYA